MIDLHTHTTASDGTYTPAELVSYAIEKGLTAVAITDHDTVAGIDEAEKTARDLPIKIIPGIEISATYGEKEVHILGYGIDRRNKELNAAAKEMMSFRDIRTEKMCDLLETADIDISPEKLHDRYGSAVITRANIARYLLEQGYVASKDEAFEKYLGRNSGYYVRKQKVAISEAVNIIKTAGGVAVLAHPVLYKLDEAGLNRLFTYAKEVGITGIEALYSNNTPQETELYKRLACDLGMFITGGSDFHGANKRIDLGTGYGDLCVPDELLKNIGEY